MMWLEPLVEVVTAQGRVAYGPVTPDDVAGLFAAGFLDGDTHELGQGLTDQIPWLAEQDRLTFSRVGVIDPLSTSDYLSHGGLFALRRALTMTPQQICDEVTQSGLRGRGGAGFPVGVKWRTVLDAPGSPKFVTCNADEGDSGTFADRMLMEGDPFMLIEGMVIAGIAVDAHEGFIYIRSEYPDAVATMRAAIETAYQAGWLGSRVLGSEHGFDLEIRVGAGAYICGEETAMLESLEGKRGVVRAKPPLPAIEGLFGKPTVVNNVLSLPVSWWSSGTEPSSTATSASAAPAAPRSSSWRATSHKAGSSRPPSGSPWDRCSRGSAGAPPPADRSGPSRSAAPSGPTCRPRSSTSAGLRGLRRGGGDDRPRRHRGLRRHRRHGRPGPLRHGVLRGRVLRQVHPLPGRRRPRCRGDRPDRRRPRPQPTSSSCRTSAS